MATRLHGILLDGLNKPIVNANVFLLARSNTIVVLGGSEAVFRTDAQGAYNITVNAGHYVVIVGPQGTEPYKAGEIVLYADSPDGSLNRYLVNCVEEELTPDVIKQVQQLVVNSEEYALQAGRSAAAANADATDARNSKASVAQSASDALVYKNDAKASETAAKTSETNAKASETAAAASAEAAKASETNAAASASAAKASETNAASSAESASDSKGFRDEAEIFATQAAAAAAAAKNSETNTKTSETNSKASEDAARQAQADAAGSANTANAAVTTINQIKVDTQKIKDDAVAETTALKNTAVTAASTATDKATQAEQSAATSTSKADIATQKASDAEAAAARAEQAASGTLKKDQNLSDLSNIEIARQNMRIGPFDTVGEHTIIYSPDRSYRLVIRDDGLLVHQNVDGFTTKPFQIYSGGTGATDAAGARSNLGVDRIRQLSNGQTHILSGDNSRYFEVSDDNAWGVYVPSTNSWSPLAIAQGGTGATTAAGARSNLGLGTAALKNTGVSGDAVPLLNADNTWSGVQTLSTPLAVASGGTGVSSLAALFTALNIFGRVVGVTQLISSGTWRPSATAKSAFVLLQAGGGAGGGASASSNDVASVGSGGNSGSAALLHLSTLEASYSCIIGSGGAGVFGASGGSGGDTSLGTVCSVVGGAGGTCRTSNNAGGNGPTNQARDYTQPALFRTGPGYGGPALTFSASAVQAGNGANSFLGGGGRSGAGNGNNSTGFGSGGGGAESPSGGTDRKGGDGAGGCILIIELS